MAVRVLVVDDAAFMRMMVKDILSKNGYEVVGEAENGMKAVEKYQELKPDLTTMDITMPEMDGISAVKEIKKIDPNANLVLDTAPTDEDVKLAESGKTVVILKAGDGTVINLPKPATMGTASMWLYLRDDFAMPGGNPST